MRKRLKYFIISLVLMFCYSVNVNALDCYYKTDSGSSSNLEAHFRVDENTGKIIFSGIVGTFEETSDHKNVEGQGQKVENWAANFNPAWDVGTNIQFSGQDWYNKNKICPPYAVFVDRAGQFDLVVSDLTHLLEFKNYGAKKQGSVVLDRQDIENAVIYYPSSCLGLNKVSCENNKNFACVWNEEHGYFNVDYLLYVSCGDARDIPIQVPALISFFVNFLKIVTPIILIFIGIITLVKALAASKEDEIKKAQGSLVKKLIAAAMVFFVVTIVQFVISLVADAEYKSSLNDKTEKDNLSSCLKCFLNNECEQTAYYKTNISGQDWCTDLDSKNFDLCPEEKVQQ